MLKPDFIIVGAPKCGTTSLWGYLSQHPKVFMPSKKEPMFFCGYEKNFTGPLSNGYNSSMITDTDEYLQLFAQAKSEQITGEASTDYFKSGFRWNPKTKIIIVLRNPVERACSEHQHMLRDQHENLSLLDALKCENQRIDNGYIPLFWHVRRGLYADAVQQYIDLFGKDQVKIFIFDDLKSDPQRVYDELLAFLDLPDFKLNLERKWNISGIPKSQFFQKLYRGWSITDNNTRWKKTLQGLIPSKALRQKLRGRFREANLKKNIKYSEKELTILKERFSEDTIRLEQILDRKLEHWKYGPDNKHPANNNTIRRKTEKKT